MKPFVVWLSSGSPSKRDERLNIPPTGLLSEALSLSLCRFFLSRPEARRRAAQLILAALLAVSLPLRAESHTELASAQEQLEQDLQFLAKSPNAPGSGQVWLRIGRAHQRLKDWNKASEALEKGATRLPALSSERASAFEALGDILVAQEKSEAAESRYVQAIAVQPASAAKLLGKLAELGGPPGHNEESRGYERILRDFFPASSSAPAGKPVQEGQRTADGQSSEILDTDSVEQDLADTAPEALKKAAKHPETLWKSLQVAQNEPYPNWSVVLEVSQRILEMSPDFAQAPEIYLARARACGSLTPGSAGILPAPASAPLPATAPAPARKSPANPPPAQVPAPPEALRAWIAYGLALDRCKADPSLHFAARAELAQLYARTAGSVRGPETGDKGQGDVGTIGPRDNGTGDKGRAVTPGNASVSLALTLALAHAEALETQFHDRATDLAPVLDFIGDHAFRQQAYDTAIQAYSKVARQDAPSQEWLVAPQKLAAAYKASGDAKAALEWSERFAREYSDRMDKYLAAAGKEPTSPNAGYFTNRSRFSAQDTASGLEEKLLSLSIELGQQDRAEEIRRGLYIDLLGHVPARGQWLAQARLAAQARNTDEALACYLRSLKPARTVLPQMKAQHAANQAYLDELRAPQPEDELQEIFSYVCSSGFTRSSPGSAATLPPSGTATASAVASPANPPSAAILPPSSQSPEVPTTAESAVSPAQPLESGTTNPGKEPRERGTTNEELVSTIVKTWQLYWQQERDGRRQDARSILQYFISSTPPSHTPTPLLPLYALLTLAKSYQQEGIHFRALTAFDEAEALLAESELLTAEKCPSLHYFFSTAITYGRALSYFRRGQYDLAAQHFAKVTSPTTLSASGGPPNSHTPTLLLPPASYRIAQCLEFQGDSAKASESYAALAKAPTTPVDLRRLSAFAFRRIDQACSPKDPAGARLSRSSSGAERERKPIYLGENRSDFGDWKYNHPGNQALILCAMQCPFDVVCGRDEKPRASAGNQPRPLDYQLSTSDPKEKGRRWISRLDDPSPSALWDPIRHAFTSSNWDDYGEQYAVGQGPDLIVDLGIPAGAWRLSLSFINDHNYYEPNRAYTVYLKDGGCGFLAGCDVQDHLCGVYKHFAVFGPQVLKVYVSRDLSLNTVLSGIFLDPLGKPSAAAEGLSISSEEADAGSGVEFAALKQAYDRLTAALERPATESAAPFSGVWTVVEVAEKCVAPAGIKAAGRTGSAGDPRAAPANGNPAKSPKIPATGALYACWVKWQALRLAAVSAAEEEAALETLSQSMAARLGTEQTLTRLTGLRDQCLAAGELGRAELLEDQRIALALPKLSNADDETALRETAFRFYALDHLYAESKLRPVVEAMAADPDPGRRSERLQALSKACREKKAWTLAQRVYETIESKVPLKNRGDEHFRHYFRSLEYQGRPKEAVAILQKHLKDLPDSEWDILWRLNLVSHLLATGQVDEAVEANKVLLKKHPKHASVDNLEFLIGLKLFQAKKDRAAARERFLWVIRNFPKSYWATSSKRMLQQMGEKVPE